jgi:prepilin-type N-terminal cleavage/methylation domain-containing protein
MEVPLSIPTRSRGFSLIELLLVLAIIGILGGIAIPSFLGQRKRARVIGDAQSNARVLAMALESRKADTGLYGTSGTNQNWTWDPTAKTWTVPSSATTLAPTFLPQGNSYMSYKVSVTGGGLAYSITVTDPTRSGSHSQVLTATQTGAVTLSSTY